MPTNENYEYIRLPCELPPTGTINSQRNEQRSATTSESSQRSKRLQIELHEQVAIWNRLSATKKNAETINKIAFCHTINTMLQVRRYQG